MLNRSGDTLLGVDNLKRHYSDRATFLGPRNVVYAVDQVSFDIRKGETLGLVGESGCGKSTTGRLVVGLDRPTAGEVYFEGQELSKLSEAEWRLKRRDIQIIFQNPLASLDPRITIRRQIRLPLDIHGILSPSSRDQAVTQLMDAVSLNQSLGDRYPHQISGGQAQRVAIARALALEPKLIVCDEAVSALDVSVQSTITALLIDLQQKRGLAYLFISHDLRVVKKLSHRVAVMYLGEIVETGPTDELYARPLHPYTAALIAAIPSDRQGEKREAIRLLGDPPSPSKKIPGCRFRSRCRFARERCALEHPEMRAIEGRLVRCHFAEEIALQNFPRQRHNHVYSIT